jgi:nucleoside-diphosphate-sugar epimerase
MKAKNPTLVEEEQGKAVVDAALAHNVAHLVYTSVDRGGDAKSYETPTKVPHFISKHNIEHHLVDRSAGSDLSWTILRPVAFMDNLQPGFAGKIFPTAWKGVKRPLQLIAVRDIGVVGAKAFLEPEKYKNRGLGLAGDELNYAQANEVFCKKTGIDMSTTFWFLIKLLFWFVADVRLMFEWFDSDGYGVDIARLRKEIPELLDFGEFIKEQGKFELKKDV